MDGEVRRHVKRAVAGDRAALERLLRRIDARVLHLAYRLLADAEDAHDVRQWVLFKVARSVGRFDGNAAFDTWLHRIVVNACRDRQRERAASERLLDRASRDLREPASEHAADSLARDELGRAVAAAVRALPEDEREVLVLRHYESLAFPRIAEILDAPETTLKSRFQRALTRLATALEASRAAGTTDGDRTDELQRHP